MKWIILILGIATNASASIMVKISMSPPFEFPSIENPLHSLLNWPFWLGLALYGMAFLLYAAALARLPLNIAHPILTSGAIATVALSSSLVFNEKFQSSTIVGIIFIVIGVSLIARQ